MWVAVLFLTGCHWAPLATLASVTAPNKEDIQAPEYLTERLGTVPVIVSRDAEFLPTGFPEQLYLEGAPVAKLRPAHKITIYLYPGTYRLAVGPNCTCGSGFSEVEAQVSLQDPPTYRISASRKQGVFLTRTQL
jgi:hypothetical protein